MKRSLASLSLMVFAGAMNAQPPAPRPHFVPGGNPDAAEQRFEQRLAQNLTLSADQQNKVHTALAEGRVLSQGMGEKMLALHTALNTAIKNGDEASIDKTAQDIATLHQQEVANHAKTTAKIYATLTADQKTKVGDHLEMLGGAGPGFGRGFGPPPGARARRGPQPQNGGQ